MNQLNSSSDSDFLTDFENEIFPLNDSPLEILKRLDTSYSLESFDEPNYFHYQWNSESKCEGKSMNPISNGQYITKKSDKLNSHLWLHYEYLEPSKTFERKLINNNPEDSSHELSDMYSWKHINSNLEDTCHDSIDMCSWSQSGAKNFHENRDHYYNPYTPTCSFKCTPESGDGCVYLIKFKHFSKYYLLSMTFKIGIPIHTWVKVEADRGEDIGIVVDKQYLEGFNDAKLTLGRNGTLKGDYKRVIAIANEEEKYLLALKVVEETKAVEVCSNYAFSMGLSMKIVDAEYQFDRHKLIFYYSTDKRVDFRFLVSELFSLYRTRIWMQQVETLYKCNSYGERFSQLSMVRQY